MHQWAHKGGGAPSVLVDASWVFRLDLQVSGVSSGPRKIIMKVFIPFGIPFLRNSKIGEKQELVLGSRLIG